MLEGGKLLLLASEPGFAATVSSQAASIRARAGKADGIYKFLTLHFEGFPPLYYWVTLQLRAEELPR